MNKVALITGSAGLVGSECVRFFAGNGFQVLGVDNNMRKQFFGEGASVEWNKKLLIETVPGYVHCEVDIRDRVAIEKIFAEHHFDLIIHCASQPSHDWAARDPHTDFSINADGTLVLLESFRRFCPDAVFIFTSTNKVYGDRPNALPLIELETRYELPEDHPFYNGIDETMSIDNCLHSLFGASKVAADILTQEYGRYFGLKTVVFRGGCLTGPAHSGTELHGFLSHLVKCCLSGRKYVLYGYKGKQVRDNMHSQDLISAFYHYYLKPRSGEVYNMGGSRVSNVSVLEAIRICEGMSGKKLNFEYVDTNRRGDHMWWISDVSKFRGHFPDWKITYDTVKIVEDIVMKEKGADRGV